MPYDAKDYLINKIVTHAGTVNHIILTDQEIQQGKDILRDEEQILSKLDLEIRTLMAERDRQQERITKFRVAFALHKRIPSEILSSIFIHCLPPEAIDAIAIPPVPSQAPWLLGQICSLWRNVSRNEPRLWGGGGTLALEPHHTRRYLNRIYHVLPPIILLSREFRGDVEAVRTNIVPYLWRIQELSVHLDIASYDELWRIVSPRSFAMLRSAQFHIEGMDRVNEHRNSRWDGAKPFQLANSLRKLKLASPEIFSPALLSLDIPWNQLTDLDISNLEDPSFRTTCVILQQCSSLEYLSIKFEKSNVTLVPDYPLNIPALRGLHIARSIPSALINRKSLWEHLSTLNLADIDLDDGQVLHSIIKQSTQLTSLTAVVPHKGTAYTSNGDLLLPHLTSLELSPIHETWIFTSLVTPVLTALNISFKSQLDLSPVLDMLIRSRCSLTGFGLVHTGAGGIHSSYIRDFLTIIPAAEVFGTGAVFMEDQILQEIGQGKLLPRLRSLYCWPISLQAFVEMLEMRLEREVQQGCLTLSRVIGHCPPGLHDPNIRRSAEIRLELLRTTYGMDCSLE